MEKQLEKAKQFIAAKKELDNEKNNWLRLDLTTFSKDKDDDLGDDDLDEDDDGEGDDEDDDDSEPSLEQMLKENPALKKQYNALFKSQFSKRLKGIDLKEAKRLLREEAERKSKEEEDEDKDKANSKADEISKKEEKLNLRVKRAAVKEYAAENNLNPKLLARLVDLDKLDIDEDGEIDPDELEELVEELTEEFPELFRKVDSEDEEEDEGETKKSKSRSHKVVGKKKTNNGKDVNLKELGKNKALERAKRKGLIKEE